MVALADAEDISTMTCGSPSKPMTAIWSWAPRRSTAALAAVRASWMGTPCMEPDLSMTRTMARLGFCFSFS